MIDLKKVGIFGAIISSALVLSACNLYKSGGQTQNQQQETQSLQQIKTQAEQIVGETIKLTDSGFVPTEVKVKSGSKITWVNDTDKTVQIGSDPHPTHTANKELSNGEFVLEMTPGASAMVTLEKTGSFGYHDHLNPGMKGKVVVE